MAKDPAKGPDVSPRPKTKMGDGPGLELPKTRATAKRPRFTGGMTGEGSSPAQKKGGLGQAAMKRFNDTGAGAIATSAVKGAAKGGGVPGAAKNVAQTIIKDGRARKNAAKSIMLSVAPGIIALLILSLLVASVFKGITASSGETVLESNGVDQIKQAGMAVKDLDIIKEVSREHGVEWTVVAAIYRSGNGSNQINNVTGPGGNSSSDSEGGGDVPAEIEGCTGTGQKGSFSDGTKKHPANVRQYLYNCFQTKEIGGYRSDPGSDHNDGLALDVMISKNGTRTDEGHKNGDTVAAWARANAKALNIKYIIWEQKIWNARRGDANWRPMEDRGSVSANHFDHVHISFNEGDGDYDFSAKPMDMGDPSSLSVATNLNAAPRDPENLCSLKDDARPEDMSDEEWEATRKDLRKCSSIVGAKLSKALNEQPGWDGSDIASGGRISEGGKIDWAVSDETREKISNTYKTALSSLPLEPANEQWATGVFDMALQWRLGLSANQCVAPNQGPTASENWTIGDLPPEGIAGYDGKKLENAAEIFRTGKNLGMSEKDVQAGLAAAIGETKLLGGVYGVFKHDQDYANGKRKLLEDAEYASRKFFLGHTAKGGEKLPGLRQVKDRESKSVAKIAAEAMGKEEDKYEDHVADAKKLFEGLIKIAQSSGGSSSTGGEAQGTSTSAGEEPESGITVTSSDGQTINLGAAQLQNVAKMVQAFKGYNGFASEAEREQAMLIATMTMAVESHWRNLASEAVPESKNYPNDGVAKGDHDSVGLFQQRALTGAWGTPKQLMDPTYASLMFLGADPEGAPAGHARGLLQIPNWQHIDLGKAAQSVQVSAFPDRYAMWEQASREVLEAASGVTLSGASPEACTSQTSDTTATPGEGGMIGDKYMVFWKQTNGGRDGIDPWRFFWGECVSWAAFYVRSTSHPDFENYWTYNGKQAHFGNGGEWAFEAKKIGIPVDQTPAVGSIATWYGKSGRYPQPNGRTNYGHVASVAAVNPDGTIDIEQYNAIHHRYSMDKGVDPKKFNAYIHFEKAPRQK